MDDSEQFSEERPQYAPISTVTGGSPIHGASANGAARNGQEEEAGTFHSRLGT